MFAIDVSGRVRLRLLKERHASALHALVFRNYARLEQWCPWLHRVETIEKTGDFIREKLARFAQGDGFTAGFFHDDAIVGVVALEYVDRPNLSTEIGYWLDADAEGGGLVTNACRRLIDHAFGELQLQRVQIRSATENIRSRAIPENLGFTQEGVIRQCERLHDRTVDLAIYGLLAHEWVLNHGPG